MTRAGTRRRRGQATRSRRRDQRGRDENGAPWVRATVRSTALPRFLLLYAALYAAGVASPFLPALVNARGVPAAQLGLVLSAGTAIRLLTAPLAGRLGDFIQGLRLVLVVCLVLAAGVTLGYLPAQGFWPFLALSLGHAAALAPVTILADAGAGRGRTATQQRPPRVRVRLGTWDGLGGLHCWHLAGGTGGERLGPRRDCGWPALGAAWGARCRNCGARPNGRGRAGRGVLLLLRLPPFRRLVLVAALILGSHAMHDAFAVIRWRAAA